jgi:DNA-binding CsgD family transcriptional regulator
MLLIVLNDCTDYSLLVNPLYPRRINKRSFIYERDICYPKKGGAMHYYFISDNRFFLEGVRETELKNQGGITCLLPRHVPWNFWPQKGDIVVLNMTDAITQRQILRLSVLACCRVIILLRADLVGAFSLRVRDKFPWCLPDTLSLEALLACLAHAAKTATGLREITPREQMVIRRLGSGCSASDLAQQEGITVKSVSLYKRNALAKYGLSGTHPSAVLFCRNMTEMKRHVDDYRPLSPGVRVRWKTLTSPQVSRQDARFSSNMSADKGKP